MTQFEARLMGNLFDSASARSATAGADNNNNNKFAACVAWRGSHQIQKFPIVSASNWVVYVKHCFKHLEIYSNKILL